MSESDDMMRILAKVRLEDLQLDEEGRVVVDQPELAALLRQKGLDPGGARAWNVGCSNTGCGGREIEKLRERLVRSSISSLRG